MSEKKRKGPVEAGTLAAVLLMALAVGLLVLLAIAALVSALVVRGWAEAEILNGAALAALFMSALFGGLFACRRLGSMPLVWGLSVGALLALVCLAAGALTYGVVNGKAMVLRIAAPLLGGVLAGVLRALRRK